MLSVENLGRRFGPRWIFRHLAFQLGVGDRLVVLGPNGSGKSTLLKVVAGLLPASEGAVAIDGDARTSLGYSAIEQSLYPTLSIAEHLEYAAAMRGISARVDELLAKVGLDDARNKPASQISTGMKSRLRVALAIQPNPSVLLLDEPGAALDPAGKALIRAVADEQTLRGCLLLATNDPEERSLANLELQLLD